VATAFHCGVASGMVPGTGGQDDGCAVAAEVLEEAPRRMWEVPEAGAGVGRPAVLSNEGIPGVTG
jgi:hypothetical protein